MINETVPLTISVSKIVAANLARRAAPMNIRPSEYARRLFEAAYAARIAQERGEDCGDPALERQVRDVFLLADCEPDFIAEALGLPVERVRRILDGWRQVAIEPRTPPAANPAAAAGVTATPPPPPAIRKVRSDGYTTEQVSVIAAMWREGKEVKDIAAAIGRPAPGLSNWAGRHRDICPKRRA